MWCRPRPRRAAAAGIDARTLALDDDTVRVAWCGLVLALSLGGARADSNDPAQDPASAGSGSDADSPYLADADAQKLADLLDRVAQIVVTDHDSCERMAADLGQAIDDSTGAIATANEARQAGKLPGPALEDRARAALAKMRPATATCAKDDKVHAAFQRLDAIKK